MASGNSDAKSGGDDAVNVDLKSDALTTSGGVNDTCLQLALEGEKLCKAGNCRDGVAFFEAALQVNHFCSLPV